MKIKRKQMWACEEFTKLLQEIKKERITLGKDAINKIKADWRITLALARHPLVKEKVKEDIICADLD